jgi:hypothetical protein
MSSDPISAFRAELRSEAARKANAYQRRRRSTVAIGAVLAAVLIVGGAIAAQSRWLDSGGRMKVRFTAAGRAAALDFPARGYANCMAAHRSRRLNGPAGAWTLSAMPPRNRHANSSSKRSLLPVASPRQPGKRELICPGK